MLIGPEFSRLLEVDFGENGALTPFGCKSEVSLLTPRFVFFSVDTTMMLFRFSFK